MPDAAASDRRRRLDHRFLAGRPSRKPASKYSPAFRINAIKYSAHEAEPKIPFGDSTRNGTPVYRLKDNGVGFGIKCSNTLFGAFQKLHRALNAATLASA